MKKLTGTIEPSGKAPPRSTPLAVRPSVPVVKSESLTEILHSLKRSDGQQLVDYNQAVALTSLKFERGDQILTLMDRPFVYEVVNMLNSLDYDVVYNFLDTKWERVFGRGPGLRKKIIFENPLLASSKEKLSLDMEIFRNKVDVAKGAVDCKKCGSDETIAVEKQLKAADEPMTIRVTCLQCGHKWTAQ